MATSALWLWAGGEKATKMVVFLYFLTRQRTNLWKIFMDVDPITEVTNAFFLLRPGGRVPERPHTWPSGCGVWKWNTDCGEEQGWGQCSSVRAGCSNSAQTHTGTLGDYCCLIYHSQVAQRCSASKFHHTLTFTDSEDYCTSTVWELLFKLQAFSWKLCWSSEQQHMLMWYWFCTTVQRISA